MIVFKSDEMEIRRNILFYKPIFICSDKVKYYVMFVVLGFKIAHSIVFDVTICRNCIG